MVYLMNELGDLSHKKYHHKYDQDVADDPHGWILDHTIFLRDLSFLQNKPHTSGMRLYSREENRIF